MADYPRSVREYIKSMASIGGKARAAALSPRRRSEIARKAVQQRWRKHNGAKRAKRTG